MDKHNKRKPQGRQTNGARGTYHISIVPPTAYAKLILRIKQQHTRGIY